jgi:hypothetical protein
VCKKRSDDRPEELHKKTEAVFQCRQFAKDGAAVLLAKKPMVAGQTAAVFADLFDEEFALLVVVMEMHFHVGDSQPHHLRNAVEQIAPVLLLRIEEGVLRALARGVPRSVTGNARPHLAPLGHAPQRGLNRCAHAQRFVVIRDGNPGALRLRAPRDLPQAALQIRPKPDIRVARELHGRVCPVQVAFACGGFAAIQATSLQYRVRFSALSKRVWERLSLSRVRDPVSLDAEKSITRILRPVAGRMNVKFLARR